MIMPSTNIVQFSFNWNVKTDFEKVNHFPISKRFVTAYKNVPFYWRAVFNAIRTDRSTRFAFWICYDDGPLKDLDGVCYELCLIKDGKVAGRIGYAPAFKIERGSDRGWSDLGWNDASSIRTNYGLLNSDPLLFRIPINIPMAAFAYSLKNPLPTSDATAWQRDMFEKIENPTEAICYSMAKFISRDNRTFYIEKAIIGAQSNVFAAMFRHPPANNTAENEYRFGQMSGRALKKLLEYVYTGRTSFSGILIAEVLEIADAAEQYGFEQLKIACGSWLWNYVVANPKSCFDIVTFARLHEDLKYVKQRAFDVLAENYDDLNLGYAEIAERFGGGDEGKLLRNEFNLYVYRRMEPALYS